MPTVRLCYREAAEILIAHGAEVNIKKNDGQTPLHCAAYFDRANVIELLIASGADIHAQSNGGTPLHMAAKNGCSKAAEILIGVWSKTVGTPETSRGQGEAFGDNICHLCHILSPEC